MKPTVYRYGLYSVIALVVLSAIDLFVLAKFTSFATQEITGYLTMLLSMIFVFLGIRYYRDHYNNGQLSFGKGLKIGLLIVLIPSVAFGLFDLLYTRVLNPGWFDTYYAHQLDEIRKAYPAERAAEKIKTMEQQKEMFSNPIFEFLLMAATVFIIGFIVSIISSLTLMRKSKPSIA